MPKQSISHLLKLYKLHCTNKQPQLSFLITACTCESKLLNLINLPDLIAGSFMIFSPVVDKILVPTTFADCIEDGSFFTMLADGAILADEVD